MGKGFTGTGSVREGQTFRIEPDLIRALKRGEAALIWKSPSLLTDYIKLDFFGHPALKSEFKPNHNPVISQDKEPEEESGQLENSKTGKLDSIQVDNPLQVIQEVKELRKKPV